MCSGQGEEHMAFFTRGRVFLIPTCFQALLPASCRGRWSGPIPGSKESRLPPLWKVPIDREERELSGCPIPMGRQA